MTKILDISTDQQTPNRLFYDGTGNVKQVVDAAQNIPFTQPDLAKRPVLNITEGAFEFDGVDDVLLSNETPIEQIGLSDFTVEYWCYLPSDLNAFNGVFGDRITNTAATGFISIYMTNNRLVNFRFGNTTIETANFPEYLFPLDEYVHIAACRKLINSNYRTFLYVNGLLVNTKNISDNIQHTNNPWILGRFSQNEVNQFKGSIKGLQISSFAKYPVDELTTLNRKLFNPTSNPFPYFKRYKEDGNKKLFISSRYLEGADIDRNGEINSINSELPAITGLTSTANKPKINNSILFNTTNTLFSDPIGVSYGINSIDDFYIGFWVSPSGYDSYPYSFAIGSTGVNNRLSVGAEIGNKWGYTINDGSGNSITNGFIDRWVNEFRYITVLRKNGNVYFFQNGVLIDVSAFNHTIETVNAPIYISGLTTVGQYGVNGLYDDVLLSVDDSIINPTGYAIGDKCFVPPSRKSLDSRFIQL